MAKKEGMLHLVYHCIHSRAAKEMNGNNIIPRRRLFELFGKVYHIPRKLKYPVLKEMIHINLFECPNNNQVKVLPAEIDIKNISQVQQLSNFY